MSEEIADPMTDNEALRRILSNVQTVEEFLRGNDYDSIEGEDVTVSDTSPFTSAANALTSKAVVVNRGSDSVSVAEDGVTIGVVEAGKNFTLPMSGKGEITVSIGFGSCAISFARYLLSE